jgi:hypothetical protein
VDTEKNIEFEIKDGGITDDNKLLNLLKATVKHDKWPHSLPYMDFLKSFKALH